MFPNSNTASREPSGPLTAPQVRSIDKAGVVPAPRHQESTPEHSFPGLSGKPPGPSFTNHHTPSRSMNPSSIFRTSTISTITGPPSAPWHADAPAAPFEETRTGTPGGRDSTGCGTLTHHHRGTLMHNHQVAGHGLNGAFKKTVREGSPRQSPWCGQRPPFGLPPTLRHLALPLSVQLLSLSPKFEGRSIP